MTFLRLLLLEDTQDGKLLLLNAFKNAGYALVHQRVQTAGELISALESASWDVIISNFQMPHFSSMQALHLLNTSQYDIPFIIISRAIGEELAVEAMRAGADDYLMKDNLKRLVPAVERAMREAKNRRQHRQAEQELEEVRLRMEGIIASALDAIITVNQQQKIVLFNKAAECMFGYSAAEVLGKEMEIFNARKVQRASWAANTAF